MSKLIVWHYTWGLKKFFEIWRDFLGFIWFQFSVWNFLRTLFSPWRRDVSRVAPIGFHPVLFLGTLAENIITRILGAVVKITLIFFALFLEIFFLAAGVILALVWIFAPVLFVFSFGEILFSGFWKSGAIPFSWAALFLASSFVWFISFRSARSEERNYFFMDFSRLGKEEWFERVWNRIGKNKADIGDDLPGDKKKLQIILNEAGLNLDEFSKIVEWETKNQVEAEEKKKFWTREHLYSRLPVGKNWIYAYTVKLDRYSRDLSEGDFSEYKNAELVGKDGELEQLSLILVKPAQSNAIIIGEPGAGRETIVHTLARKIRLNQAILPLEDKRILELDLKEILSNCKAEESEGVSQAFFREAALAGNVILVIKDIHEFLGGSSKGTGWDISSVLSEYLARPAFQIIGTTTPAQFHSCLEKKESVMKYCDKVWVKEMKKEDVLRVLLYKLRNIEKDRIRMTWQALREIIDLSDRYVTDSPYPEKALDVMEDVILYWAKNPVSEYISKETVDQAMSSKLNIPLGDMGEGESEKMLNLENVLHQRVVGQDLAVSQIAETARRSRIGMSQKNKPLGSFLFMGPTGVGKTESAKALAEAYFGDENRMIRLDMSEYQSVDSLEKIVGSAATGREGYLTGKVKENPRALLLLDEIEKAGSEILNLFLQVLDEGYLTDAFGKKISFRNLIIIATSNAGSDVIKNSIQSGLGAEETQSRLTEYVISQGIFKTEFLNRFEGVVYFHPLFPEDILKVTRLLLEKYSIRVKEQKNIAISFEEGVAEYVAQSAYDPVFGARAINRFIQDNIEDVLVKKIISKEVRENEVYVFKREDIKL